MELKLQTARCGTAEGERRGVGSPCNKQRVPYRKIFWQSVSLLSSCNPNKQTLQALCDDALGCDLCLTSAPLPFPSIWLFVRSTAQRGANEGSISGTLLNSYELFIISQFFKLVT